MASIRDLATAASAAAVKVGGFDHVPPAGPGTPRGSLIVLEGLDRSGKTTQVKLLEQRFVELGKKVRLMRFPDRTTPIGQMIDAYLRSQVDLDDHVIHLLFSANRWEAVETISALLAAGVTVLCDRYYYSGIVYSAAKQNPTLTLQWARAPEIGLPRPDLVLFMDLDEEQAKARGGFGSEVYERSEMQKRVRDLFWGLSMGKIGTAPAPDDPAAAAGDTARPGIIVRGEVAVGPPTPQHMTGMEQRFRQEEEDLHVIDASPPVEEVSEAIWEVVKKRIEAVERGELGTTVRKVS